MQAKALPSVTQRRGVECKLVALRYYYDDVCVHVELNLYCVGCNIFKGDKLKLRWEVQCRMGCST